MEDNQKLIESAFYEWFNSIESFSFKSERYFDEVNDPKALKMAHSIF